MEEENGFYSNLEEKQEEQQEEEQEETGPPLNLDKSPSARFTRLNPKWSEKLWEKTKSQIKGEAKRQEKRAASYARKKAKIRKEYKTNWIWKIIDSNPREDSKNGLIKANLTREVNRHMPYILECLGMYAMKYYKTERLVRSHQWGLDKIVVPALVKNKYVDRKRVPVLVELDVRFFAKEIGISEGAVWKNLQGLEAEGFVVPVGKKRGKKGRLRMIGSFVVKESDFLRLDEKTGLAMTDELSGKFLYDHVVEFIKPVYFWGRGQPNVKKRLARLEKAK